MRIVYESVDGQVFETEKACLKWERVVAGNKKDSYVKRIRYLKNVALPMRQHSYDHAKKTDWRVYLDVAPTKRMAKALKEHKVWEAGKELYKYIEELKEAREEVRKLSVKNLS